MRIRTTGSVTVAGVVAGEDDAVTHGGATGGRSSCTRHLQRWLVVPGQAHNNSRQHKHTVQVVPRILNKDTWTTSARRETNTQKKMQPAKALKASTAHQYAPPHSRATSLGLHLQPA